MQPEHIWLGPIVYAIVVFKCDKRARKNIYDGDGIVVYWVVNTALCILHSVSTQHILQL